MNVSHCCGASTVMVTRSDHPHIYDDMYDLRVPVLVCTKCGKVLDPKSIEGGKEEQ
ncbi:hypothetical protein [Brevibacillus sp. NRS-1366]|uniref:hypothetical protein n=1 Tax=Brevibacillus sp. NRS-1366 TaxID=3233899 RepID=UPI003D1DDB09